MKNSSIFLTFIGWEVLKKLDKPLCMSVSQEYHLLEDYLAIREW